MLVEPCSSNFIPDHAWLTFFVSTFVPVGTISAEGTGVAGAFILASYISRFEGSFHDGCSHFGMFCGFLGLL